MTKETVTVLCFAIAILQLWQRLFQALLEQSSFCAKLYVTDDTKVLTYSKFRAHDTEALSDLTICSDHIINRGP